MPQEHTPPGSSLRVPEPFRPCFTAPTFATFVALSAAIAGVLYND
ncbi:hypothetical protein WEI85_47970 [Actinomycetes bacterium KLBMP 9797]